MPSTLITNALNEAEINYLLGQPSVKENQDKLSFVVRKVDFSMEVPEALKMKLQTTLNLDLSHLTALPMRWVKGDTRPHKDKGSSVFETY